MLKGPPLETDMIKIKRGYCAECNSNQKLKSYGVNHVFHLLLSALIGFVWVAILKSASITGLSKAAGFALILIPVLIWPVVWLVLAKMRSWHCDDCGSSVD